MSTTLKARPYARGIAGETVRMIQASHTTVSEAIERTYAALRPTVYRPTAVSVKRIDKAEQIPAGIVRTPVPSRMLGADVVLTVHRN